MYKRDPVEASAYNKAYLAQHRERIRAYKRAYHAANRERERARSKAYYAANREREKARAIAARAANPEKYNAATRQWRAANPDVLKAQRAAAYAANPEYFHAKSRAYYYRHLEELRAKRMANKGKKRLINQAWRHANPEKSQAIHARRRARERQAPINDFTAAQWQEMKNAYGHRCVYCRRKMQRLTMDHITPLAMGGAHTASNILPACQSCNSRKQAGPPLRAVQPMLLLVAPGKRPPEKE